VNKVTITCGKCGTLLMEQELSPGKRPSVMPGECVKCAEPTYGPLTVEMVAEALCDSPPVSEWTDWSDDAPAVEFSKDDFRAMARFVLRLLTELERRGDSYCRLTNTDASARQELLKFARTA
jgi:hypothetical protein